MTEIRLGNPTTVRPMASQHTVGKASAGHFLLWIPVALSFAVLLMIISAQSPPGSEEPHPTCVIEVGITC